MHKNLRFSLFFILLTLSFAACGKKPAPSPTQTSPSTAVAPVAAIPSAPAAPPSTGYEGEWKGSSGKDLPVSFSVQNNQVSSLNASYAGHRESCSFNGNFYSDGSSPINGKGFTAHGKKDQIEFNLSGTFTSPSEASGTLVWKGKSEICGDVDLQYNWTAKKESPGSTDED